MNDVETGRAPSDENRKKIVNNKKKMTKKQHIEHWMETAEQDWITVELLMNQKRFLHGLFWAHLVIEKLAKALWIKQNETNIPPKTHNINWILEQANANLDDEKMQFLLKFNKFQLSTRYPDYIENLYKTCTKTVADHQLKNIKTIRQCLLNKLP